jgi:hypothetical protein
VFQSGELCKRALLRRRSFFVCVLRNQLFSILHGKAAINCYIAEPIPAPALVFTAQAAVSGAATLGLAGIGALIYLLLQILKIIFANIVAAVVDGFVKQAAAARLFIHGYCFEATAAALHDLQRYFI